MKVAIFASAFYPHLGGVEELVRQLAHALHRSQNEVIVVTERWPRNLSSVENYEDIKVFRFPFRLPTATNDWKVRARSMAMYQLTNRAIQSQVAALMKSENIEVIHVQCAGPNALYALEASQKVGLPLIVTLQGELTMDATGLYQRSQVAREMLHRCLENADAITGCSGQTLSEAENFFGRPFGERGSVVYNGIRLADFVGAVPYSHSRPYILGIGRHVEQKGFDVLLRAYAQLLEKGDLRSEAPELILAGDGALHTQLQRLSQELGLDGRAHLIGRADRVKTAALFKGCEFFVLPSRHEPMGIVNLEAMAAGKAIIASNVGGVPELVREHENGLLVPPDDPARLASTIRHLINDPMLSARLGQEGAIQAKRFDWDNLTQRYLKIYNQAQASHLKRKTRDSN